MFFLSWGCIFIRLPDIFFAGVSKSLVRRRRQNTLSGVLGVPSVSPMMWIEGSSALFDELLTHPHGLR